MGNKQFFRSVHHADGFDTGIHTPGADHIQPAFNRRKSASTVLQRRGHLGRRALSWKYRAGGRGQRLLFDEPADQPAAWPLHGQRRGIQPALWRRQPGTDEDGPIQRFCDDCPARPGADGRIIRPASSADCAFARSPRSGGRDHRISAGHLFRNGFCLSL